MNITQFTQPKSDQLNSDDLVGGPITVTVAGVRQGSSEQPVNVDLIERPGRPYRPSKGMLRILAEAWGPETDVWTGRRLTLYRDKDVKFGPDIVGGIRISHASHIARRIHTPLTTSRGKKKMHAVEPLPDHVEATYSMPELATVEECREYFMRRQSEGASPQELEEIKSIGATLAGNDPEQ